MCEADFSKYAARNSKYHRRPDVAPDIRIHVVYNHSQLKQLREMKPPPPPPFPPPPPPQGDITF